MSAWRELGGHALLAAIGLTLAIVATRDEAEAPMPGEVEVLDCRRVDEVRFASPQRDVRIVREGRLVRLEVTRRPEGAPSDRLRFLGGPDAHAYLEGLAPLVARRSLGELADDALEDVGLDAASMERERTRWTIRCGSTTTTFDVGGRAFGTGDRYVRRADDPEVVLIAAALLRDLDTAELRLIERRLHRFERAEAERAVLRFAGEEHDLTQRNRRGANAAWVATAAPDTRRSDYDRLMRAVLGLAVTRYLEEAPELPAAVFEARFADARGRALGELTLFQVGEGANARWLARSDASEGVVEVLPSSGAAVVRAAERLDGDSER